MLAPLQALETTTNGQVMPESARHLLQHWEQALILGSINLEALRISANAVPCPPALRCLPNLKYIELTLGQSEAWVGYFFVDLSFCACLESFKITQAERLGMIGSLKLPEVQLSHLPNLKRVEFTGWFPGSECALPPDCELCVALMYGKMCAWREQWKAMQSNLTVLSLGDMGPQEWPAWLERFTRLQYFRLNCTDFQGQDLAILKAIPHVRLYIEGTASLTLTEGAWQNLEVQGESGLCITFRDPDAFVRGTDRLLFVSKGDVEFSQPMCASLQAACSRQSTVCYHCSFRTRYTSHVVRLSNCEDAMRLEPSDDGKTVPSGGLHDGYVGTPEDSPLWKRLNSKYVVSSQDVWPVWNPHKWVLGHSD